MTEVQPTFVLVHGGHAGAWVWDEVRPLLIRPSVAVDLPGHGSRPGELAALSFAECSRCITDQIPPTGPLIFVGHSLGAAVVLSSLQQLADRTIHVIVLAGPVPQPGQSVLDSFPLVMRVASRLILSLSGPTFAASRKITERTLFNGLSSERAGQAFDRLTRESAALVREPVLWTGRLPAAGTYIKCLQDRGPLSPRHQDRMAANLGEGVRMVSLDACHYAMLECPAQVAAVLNQVVAGAGRQNPDQSDAADSR